MKARYLDGAILDGPAEIDADGGDILICGDAQAQASAGGLLGKRAAKVRYLGANFAAAAALCLAWLNLWYGSFVSIAHSAKMCRAEGVDLADFASLFSAMPLVQDLSAVSIRKTG